MSKSNVRRRVQIDFSDSPSLVHPEFQAQCNIRNIMNQYKRQGIPLNIPNFSDEVIDLMSIPDYQESLNIVIKAQESLDALPAQLRKRFGNDPAKYIDYVQDASNRDEMIKFGMIDIPKSQDLDIKTSPQEKSDLPPT